MLGTTRDVLTSTTFPTSIGTDKEVAWDGVELMGGENKMELVLLTSALAGGDKTDVHAATDCIAFMRWMA